MNDQSKPDPLAHLFEGMAPLPAHLRDDASFLQCSKCGRKSWGGDPVNSTCGITAPSGEKCDGILLGQNASVVAPATLEPESKNDVVAG